MSHHYSGPDFGFPLRRRPSRFHRSLCVPQAGRRWQVEPNYERARERAHLLMHCIFTVKVALPDSHQNADTVIGRFSANKRITLQQISPAGIKT
jgi:hypothetical protein